MELDSLFSSQRWKILEIISLKPSSPVEISLALNTSVAYISQQLKLLEAAGIVAKERTGSAEKGQPRNLYSISEELLHISFLTRGKSEKRSIKVSDYRKIILRIWFMQDEAVGRLIEKIFWQFDEFFSDIEGIFFDGSKSKNFLIIISDSKKIHQKVDSLNKSGNFGIEIKCEFRDKLNLSKLPEFYSIYDPHFLLSEGNLLKGGKENNG